MKYKLLGQSGLRVSELCYGALTFGNEKGVGVEIEEAREVYRTFLEAGGNFFDTANSYTYGTSEKFLGKLIKETNNRYDLVLATKYTITDKENAVTRSGNSRKNMVQSLEESLKRLQMDYVDVLYLHIWDFTTPLDEILRAMDDLVKMGKVLYVAISDTPAWIVSRADAIAELKNWSGLKALQLHYNLILRDAEREMLPMAETLGMSVTVWGAIAGGALSGKYLREKGGRLSPTSKRRSKTAEIIIKKVVELAKTLNVTPTQLSLAWMRRKYQCIIPIIGAKTTSQLKENLQCIDVDVPDEIMKQLDEVSKIPIGFPSDFFEEAAVKKTIYSGMMDSIEFRTKPII